MPRLTLANEQVRIYDDFLPRDAFEPLLEYANSDSYSMIHQQGWHKSWRVGDGLPLIGSGAFYRDDANRYLADEESRYPTGTPLDRFIEPFLEVAAEAETLVGKRGTTWDSITFTPFLHPAGSGLSLHRDRYAFTGAYVYYVHRKWNFHWGGHLLILDPATVIEADRPNSPFESFLSDEHENRIASEPGLALCILAKPNRLVFLAPNVYHMVTNVDGGAGDRTRVTLAGFFRAPTDRSPDDRAHGVLD